MPSRNQIAIVAGLVLLATLVQVVTICRATVTGLDAVRFTQSARMIDQHGLGEALRGQREQPLFPISVWAVHRGVVWSVGEFRSSWALSAQLAAAFALVLSVVPVYFVAQRLAGATAAAWGSGLYCVLPEVSRLGADGISDPLHLLFFCLALWAVIVYLTDRAGVRGTTGACIANHRRASNGSPVFPASIICYAAINKCGNSVWLLLAGVASGLAVLVRVEGLILPAALIMALGLCQFRGDLRQRWRRIPPAVGLLGLGFCLIVGPYLVLVDSITPKAAIARVLGRYDPPTVATASPKPAGGETAAIWYLDNGRPMSFAKKEPTVSLRRRGLAPAGRMFLEGLVRAYGYWVGLLALVGAWRLRLKQFGRANCFVCIYCLLFSTAAYHFAVGEGYISARHLLPLVVVGIGSMGYGVELARRWLAGFLLKLWHAKGSLPAKRAVRISTSAIVAVATASCLIDFAQPVHASRAGHRRAAAWLAREGLAPGSVLDTRGWTGLYSGRTTYGYDQAQAAFSQRRLAYVVLEDRELQCPSERSQTLRQLLDVAAEPVTRFSGPRGRGYTGHAVVVYRWRAGRFSRWLDSRATLQ